MLDEQNDAFAYEESNEKQNGIAEHRGPERAHVVAGEDLVQDLTRSGQQESQEDEYTKPLHELFDRLFRATRVANAHFISDSVDW